MINPSKTSVFLLVSLTLAILIIPERVNSTATTALTITPSQTQLSTLSTFTVNATVNSVTDLCSWQIKITFNPYIIKCINITIPEPNIFSGHDTTGLSYIIDNQKGSLIAFNGLWESSGVNGSGVLCQLTFNAIAPGISSLAFTEIMQIKGTYLTDSKDNQILTEAYDGTVLVAPDGFTKYVFTVQIGTENYNVTILTNSTLTNFNFNYTLKTIEFTLTGPLGTKGSCSIRVPKELLNGTFAILINNKAIAYTCSTDKNNNNLCFNYDQGTINTQILLTLPQDLNGDRKVDAKDIAIVGKAFGSYPGSARWNPIADLDKNLIVDAKDVAVVCKAFGSKWNP
ncbi:MAG: hypothetical protein QXR89_01390 [Candidatus Bathyarchaeia archaeon]